MIDAQQHVNAKEARKQPYMRSSVPPVTDTAVQTAPKKTITPTATKKDLVFPFTGTKAQICTCCTEDEQKLL